LRPSPGTACVAFFIERAARAFVLRLGEFLQRIDLGRKLEIKLRLLPHRAILREIAYVFIFSPFLPISPSISAARQVAVDASRGPGTGNNAWRASLPAGNGLAWYPGSRRPHRRPSPRPAPRRSCLAPGFTVEQMVDLCIAGLASATAERVVAGGKAMEIARVKITEAARRALRGAER